MICVGCVQFSNVVSPDIERFQIKMAKCQAQGQTVSSNQIDAPLPGQGQFVVPDPNSCGAHVAQPTSKGLSHVAQQAQGRSLAMQTKNKLATPIKMPCNNLLTQTGFAATINRMVMNQTLEKASSPAVQAAYLKV